MRGGASARPASRPVFVKRASGESPTLQTKSVLVTGAAGFIASHVCEALVARGVRVVGVDNFDPFYSQGRKRANLGEIERSAEASDGVFSFIEGDLAEPGLIAGVLADHDCDTVIHLAAKAGVRPSLADPAGYARANVVGTAAVLDAATHTGVQRVVAASSSSVYGNNSKVPFSETDDVNEPISPYAATKRSCEIIAKAHHAATGLPIAMLRFFTVFGPRQRPDLAISLFLRAVGAGETIRMFGDGSTSRDYTFVSDIVGGVLSACERIGAHGFRVWNLGHDEPVRLDEMIKAVGEVTGREPVIERTGMQPGDVERTWADLSRSRDELDYAPTTSLREGMARQWDWMQTHATA